MIDKKYERQVILLLDVLPYVVLEPFFALKGGTALNFLIQNMPRLSVDIDLTYLPIKTREESTSEMILGLNRIKKTLQEMRFLVSDVSLKQHEYKLFVRSHDGGSQVKIEVNPIVRGTVFEIEKRDTCSAIDVGYQRKILDVPMLCVEELYGSKIVAALDRQHPRDLFDVLMLYQSTGMTDKIKKTFIVYLMSSNKTHELLNPTMKDLSKAYQSQFQGMTNSSATVDMLIEIRSYLIKDLKERMNDNEIEFITSFLRGEPRWSLLELPKVATLPAILWKQQNINKMTREKRKETICVFESSFN